jgi:hypothetical protein
MMPSEPLEELVAAVVAWLGSKMTPEKKPIVTTDAASSERRVGYCLNVSTCKSSQYFRAETRFMASSTSECWRYGQKGGLSRSGAALQGRNEGRLGGDKTASDKHMEFTGQGRRKG